MLFRRRWKVLIVAALTVAGGCALFCLRAAASPLVVVQRYLAIIDIGYFGDNSYLGPGQLRPVFEAVSSGARIVDALVLMSAGVTLLIIAAIGRSEIQRGGAIYYAAPPLVALWSLLTFYHGVYGFIILLSLAAALVLSRDRETLRWRQTLFWVLYLSLVVDVPGAVRRFGPYLSLPPPVSAMLLHLDRALFVTLFIAVAVLAMKRPGRHVFSRGVP